MPQRTIANGGGNWNSTSTWVEGAVPTSADFVVATATSGQLTINVAAACQYLNLNLYTNTLTMNNTITIGLASQTTTFGSGMNFAGTSSITCNVAQTFTQNTTNRIPLLTLGAGVTYTFTTNMYIQNLSGANGSQYTGAFTLNINGNLILNAVTTSTGIIGNTNYLLVGSGVISWNFGNPASATARTIQITGNYETYASSINLIHNNTFIYTSGTAGSNCNVFLGNSNTTNNTSNTLSINQPNIKIFCFNQTYNAIGGGITINLSSPLIVNSINTLSTPRTFTSDDKIPTFTFLGNSISATTLSLIPAFRTNSSTTITPGSTTYQGISLVLDRLYTHYFGSMQLMGGGIPAKPSISSNSSGNSVFINLGSKALTRIIDYDFTDVNASGGQQVVAINATLTRTTNIVNIDTGGAGSSTFFC
jgi:hypothetical protein